MTPWMRLVSGLGLALVAALCVKFLPPIIVLLLFLGGLAALNMKLRKRAREQVRRFGPETLGLRREPHDPFGLIGYPFSLFGRGSDGRIEDVHWGSWHGLEVKRFDYSWAPAMYGERTRFSCALGPVGATLPPLVVERRTPAQGLDDVPMDAVSLGSDRFDAAFDVRSTDAAFASAFVDQEMMRWLEQLGDPWGFEVNGALALAYGPPALRPEHALELLEAFVDHIPRGIRETPSPGEVQAEPSQGTA